MDAVPLSAVLVLVNAVVVVEMNPPVGKLITLVGWPLKLVVGPKSKTGYTEKLSAWAGNEGNRATAESVVVAAIAESVDLDNKFIGVPGVPLARIESC